MFKHVLRTGALALGTVLSVCALAAPAAAEDVVPEGCVGTVYYACTGDAQPGPSPWDDTLVYEVPLTVATPAVPLLPGQTVGGQQIGGVIVVGGQTVPGQSITLGGPTDPVDTGVVTPVQLCAFVTCLPAGTPVVVPGVDLPVVPVVVPPVTVPGQAVPLPVLGTVPATTTPTVGVPATDETAVLRIWFQAQDYWDLATSTCAAGGGGWHWDEGAGSTRCTGGTLDPLADFFFDQYWRAQS